MHTRTAVILHAHTNRAHEAHGYGSSHPFYIMQHTINSYDKGWGYDSVYASVLDLYKPECNVNCNVATLAVNCLLPTVVDLTTTQLI